MNAIKSVVQLEIIFLSELFQNCNRCQNVPSQSATTLKYTGAEMTDDKTNNAKIIEIQIESR